MQSQEKKACSENVLKRKQSVASALISYYDDHIIRH